MLAGIVCMNSYTHEIANGEITMTNKTMSIHATGNNSFLNNARTFLVVWLGQVVSQLGSGMTGFALGVWVYQQTGSATGFALTLLFIMLPKTVLAPVAGVIADRKHWPTHWDRTRPWHGPDVCNHGVAGSGDGRVCLCPSPHRNVETDLPDMVVE
jgi:hypothetical protein